MRILHTSDWHLGIHHGPTSRGPDQDAFLKWLLSQLRDQKIDLLVVAGDIFDSIQPSADALNRYYRFLAQLGSTGVAQVIIVGGNHDSASRLDAPSEVLEALNIRVIGGLQHYRDDPERYVIPLHSRGSDEVQAVALAVPYVHEFRLGVPPSRSFGEVFTRFLDPLRGLSRRAKWLVRLRGIGTARMYN